MSHEHQFVSYTREWLRLQRFGEYVRQLLLGAHPCDSDGSCLNLLANEVMPQVNVLGAIVMRIIARHGDGTLVVTEHAEGSRREHGGCRYAPGSGGFDLGE